jgi:peptidoglycan/xylan/chitin deacetylase (PgdA/CDA1 family)
MLGMFSNYVFAGAAQRRLYRRGPAILTYHRVGRPPQDAPDPFLYATSAELDHHLTLAKSAGLSLVGVNEALAGGTFKPQTLAVTFDDGCVSTLEEGVPVLRKHGVQAIQFIVAGRIGGWNDWDLSKDDVPERLMDKEQIRDWLAAGMLIGSHSYSHLNMRKLDAADARKEILSSKAKLEDLFGVPIHHFAFPYGGWRHGALRDLVREAGYECAFTTEFGVSSSADEMWNLRRITPLSDLELLRKAWHRGWRNVRGL